METLPMPLDDLAAAPGGLDEFRITAPREILGMLKQFFDASAELHLNARDGSVIDGTVWAIDTDRNTMALSIDASDPKVQNILESDEIVVVGYLDAVKLQFDLHGAVLVRGPQASVLNCRMPREMYRFQRRSAFRVRPAHRSTPVARLRHAEIADMQLALRVLDVSIGGCALFLPNDVPSLQPGNVFNQVQIELDADTRFHVNLRLQHVTSLSGDSEGVRLGCEFVRADSGALRTLQRYIDQTQKRGKLLSLV
jgi:c-di-GMP-binding flagellar brake protein YcgR